MKPENLTDLEYSLWSNILQIRQHKRAQIHPSTRGAGMTVVAPDHTLYYREIMPMYAGAESAENIDAALLSLEQKGCVKCGPTGRDKYFEIID